MFQLQTLDTVVVVAPQLRSYQTRFISDVYSCIRSGQKRILGFAPTGSGKTLMAAQIVQHAVARSRRVMFIVHRDILVTQTAQKIHLFNLDCGFIKSGYQENHQSLVQIASVQTLCKRNWWYEYPADLVILDECHLVAFTSIVQQMMRSIYPQAIYLGLTATPWRLSKRESLSNMFQALVCAPMPHALIDTGFLIKPSYYSVRRVDLEKVGTVADGDFDSGQLALACDRPELIQKTVQDWFSLAKNRRTIVFAVNVSHARHLAEAFTAAGVSAAYVDGTMPARVTDLLYQQLVSGQLLVLCSCQKLVEGFDVPSINAVILARPTHSRSLHFQMIGRGLRLSSETGKTDCIVIDAAGNIFRHGFVEDITSINLSESEDCVARESPKKNCPIEHGGCGAILYSFQMKCPKCAHVFPQPKKFYLVPELEQLLSEEDIERYQYYRRKVFEAYENNLDPGWVAHSFREKYGHWPPDSWAKGAIFGIQATPLQQMSYRNYLSAIARRKNKPDNWIQRYMVLEFGLEYSN